MAALTASLSHVNLGRKAIQRSDEFRELEDMAEETLFVIDGILAEAAAQSDLSEDYFCTDSRNGILLGQTRKILGTAIIPRIFLLMELAR